MRRWFPHPLMSAFLALAWLLLQRSVAPADVVTGLILGTGLALAFDRLGASAVRVRRPGTLLRLGGRVLLDIARSNLAVAAIIVLNRRPVSSGFVRIPLQLTDPYALAMLACIITATPGTIWVSHDSTQRVLVIHVLDLIDEASWIRTIKQRYEQPLLEIFR